MVQADGTLFSPASSGWSCFVSEGKDIVNYKLVIYIVGFPDGKSSEEPACLCRRC